ncbi:MAG: glycosyl hydrolase [Gemmatimonadota bacterium]|nr:MAG: glycosyl hydrolase [Gemmatimonadota bacterium]
MIVRLRAPLCALIVVTLHASLRGGLSSVACAQSSSASQDLPAPVAVTNGPHSAVETAIAIDPTNLDHIVGSAVVTIGDPRVRRISNFTYITWDGGRSWDAVAMPNPEGRVQGDDAVVIDHEGRVYRSFMGFAHLRNPRGVHPKTGLFVAASNDGGLTYEPAVPYIDHINSITPFEDKPYPGVDLSADSPYRGSVYVAWTRFTRYGSPSPDDSSFIYLVYSRDGGRTFSRPLRLPAGGGDALDGDNTVEGAVPAAGPDGTVYMAWSGPRGIEFSRSTDGGATWEAARTILDQPGGWDIEIQGLGRANGMPVTAADISDGPHRGTVYVNWADLRNNDGLDGDADIFLARSSDGGATWSEPLRVNQDPLGNDRDQFFTWMSVDPVDGSVNIVYYDRRAGDGRGVHVYLARSTDGGRTFREYKISDEPFVPDTRRFFGDYNGISAYGGRVACLWTHSTGEANVLRAAVLDFPVE